MNNEMVPPNMKSSEIGASFHLKDALFHHGDRFLKRPDIKPHLKDGVTLVHLAKIGSDFQTGLGKMSQKRKNSMVDEGGSHNSGFQSIKLSLGDQTLFLNTKPGGSELLRLYKKSTEKDTKEKIIREMEEFDAICKEVPVQKVQVKDVGQVIVKHHLVNCLHDGKERLIMVQHKKPPGYGKSNLVSSQTCQVCLTDPKKYNQLSSLLAQPVLFPDIKNYSLSPMHMRIRVMEAVWNAAIELLVSQEPCTKVGQPCTLHPAPGTKATRGVACEAKENIKRRLQRDFQDKIGLRIFFPEPSGGNSNTGNIATRLDLTITEK